MDNNPTFDTGAKPKKRFGAWFTKKKIIWTVIILAIVGFVVWRIKSSSNPAGNIQTETVKKQNLKATVLATGQVVSGTDLQLSFRSGGVVAKVNVKEGQKVKANDILASLDQRDQLANATQAQGALAQARANYEKVLAGASNEDVAVAQRAVDSSEVALNNAKSSLNNIKQQQQVQVSNAYSALLNSTPAAIANSSNLSSVTVAISGTYTGTDQGKYVISIFSTGSGPKFTVSGLETGNGDVKTVGQPIGSRGLFISFSNENITSSDSWTISIPNTQAVNYVTNYNTYQASLQTQKSAVDTAQSAVDSAQVNLAQVQASLDLKRAQARPADIDAAKASILSAQGQVQAAQANLENTIVRAPAAGTITAVDIKVGEQAAPSKEVVVLQDVGNLHIEANVSEANIAQVLPGQTVDTTFDALGPDRHFNAKVETVNPASTVVSGVVNYKVTASVDSISEIKPGMTANMTVLVDQKDNVLAIPSRAVINNGQKHVRVIDDSKKKTYHEVEVKTGLEADGGLVEITSGLNEGQEIVTFIKQ